MYFNSDAPVTPLFSEFLLRLALGQFENSQHSIKGLETNLLPLDHSDQLLQVAALSILLLLSIRIEKFWINEVYRFLHSNFTAPCPPPHFVQDCITKSDWELRSYSQFQFRGCLVSDNCVFLIPSLEHTYYKEQNFLRSL